jgi:putative AIP processing-secretion protein
MMLLNIVTTLFLGILFQLFVPCILLNLSFIPLRINAGGYHADNPAKCYVNSTIMIAVLLAAIK